MLNLHFISAVVAHKKALVLRRLEVRSCLFIDARCADVMCWLSRGICFFKAVDERSSRMLVKFIALKYLVLHLRLRNYVFEFRRQLYRFLVRGE